MPIYEYQCQSCEHEFEILQKMSDDVLTDCPECKQAKLKKIMSASAFHLKGSGWYQSDFKNSSKSSAKPGDNKKNSSSKTAAKTSCCSSSGCGCS